MNCHFSVWTILFSTPHLPARQRAGANLEDNLGRHYPTGPACWYSLMYLEGSIQALGPFLPEALKSYRAPERLGDAHDFRGAIFKLRGCEEVQCVWVHFSMCIETLGLEVCPPKTSSKHHAVFRV